jgi:hypothetical protein
MRLLELTGPILASLVATSFASARAEQEKAQQPAPKEAAAKAEPGLQLAFSVTGLTAENSAKVKESLASLANPVFACEKCMFEQASAGKCSACNVDLMAKKHACFQGVMPSAEDSTLKLTLDPTTTVRFSEIEKALAKNAVKIDPARFPIPGKAHLVFAGAMADTAPTIEKALKDAKLFDDVKASFDAATSEIHVAVRAGATPPTRAKVQSSLEAGSVKLGLADVLWGHGTRMKKPAG